ncbi:Amine oxidase [flavin-containing] B [Tetrabaena socialis]|uniref:monoamine oxidase n=1 Tax=Tetrabaena socialis TaxID=47790 RepID=A0A2J7ZKL3_9CHLO|nr:Amine oxidase [flavin-containing] B [Tetrabaena socialis]|eukprot:PNH00790.1 Amine oxidase [flavin-containing] B [Tetrabaena socialis]
MYMGSAVKTITVYKECFWKPFTPHGQLDELGPVANLFPTTVSGCPALVGLVTAGAAKKFAALPEEERRAQVLAQYEKYFCSAKAYNITAFHSKDWIHETYSKGCYAALMPPRLATCCGGAVRAPEGRVCFAGTELATSWPGYFEGALDAGYRAAGEVVALLSR